MLHELSLALVELLETTSLDAITYKSFVLMALTLDARRGELCALRCGQFLRPAVDSFGPLGRCCGPVPCQSLAGLFGLNCGPYIS